MWQELLRIPHPTLPELIVSAEVFCILYPLRMVMRILENEEKKLQRQIMGHHRKHHLEHARWCKQEDCPRLTSTQSLRPSPPELAQQLAAQVSQSDLETSPH